MTTFSPGANSTLSQGANVTEFDWYGVPYADCKEKGGVLVGTDCDHPQPVPDVFFFSCLLFIFTFCMAYALKEFRSTSFFPSKVRLKRK